MRVLIVFVVFAVLASIAHYYGLTSSAEEWARTSYESLPCSISLPSFCDRDANSKEAGQDSGELTFISTLEESTISPGDTHQSLSTPLSSDVDKVDQQLQDVLKNLLNDQP